MHTTTLDIDMEIEYANARNGVWEPLLEPCEVRLSSQHNRHTLDYAVEASVPTELNVNITADLVDALLHTYALKQQSAEAAGKEVWPPQLSPQLLTVDFTRATLAHDGSEELSARDCGIERRFCLVNQTGLPLDFWATETAGSTASACGFGSGAALHGAALHLDHNHMVEFDFWDARAEGIGMRAILAPSAGCHICIRCAHCQPGAARIDFGGETTFRTRGDGGLLYAVVVQVMQEARNTRVVVRSPVQLRNSCPVPLECLLYSPQARSGCRGDGEDVLGRLCKGWQGEGWSGWSRAG